MSELTELLEESGLVVLNLADDPAFLQRPLRTRNASLQIEALDRLARSFVASPESLMQELVETAVAICGADSAGISIEQHPSTEDSYYHWIATAGHYSGFMDARLPRVPSACGVCLERAQPQIFRVSPRFFQILGVEEAAPVTDGILLPWEHDGLRGTIFIMAHGRTQAFDANDSAIMQALANFAAAGLRQQRQKQILLEQAAQVAAAAMANDLAHQINNPLQGLTNLLYLAAQSNSGSDAQALAQQACDHLEQLSELIASLLALQPRRGGSAG